MKWRSWACRLGCSSAAGVIRPTAGRRWSRRWRTRRSRVEGRCPTWAGCPTAASPGSAYLQKRQGNEKFVCFICFCSTVDSLFHILWVIDMRVTYLEFGWWLGEASRRVPFEWRTNWAFLHLNSTPKPCKKGRQKQIRLEYCILKLSFYWSLLFHIANYYLFGGVTA